MDRPSRHPLAFIYVEFGGWKMDFGAFWKEAPSPMLLAWMLKTREYIQESYDDMRSRQRMLDEEGSTEE